MRKILTALITLCVFAGAIGGLPSSLRKPRQAPDFFNLAFPPIGSGQSRVVADGVAATDVFALADGNGLKSDQNGAGIVNLTPATDNGTIITESIEWGCQNGYENFYIPAGTYRIGNPTATSGYNGIKVQSRYCDKVKLYGAGIDKTTLLFGQTSGGHMIHITYDDVGGSAVVPPGANVIGGSTFAEVTSITAATPPIITTAEDTNLVDGDFVKIRNCSGITGLNDNTYIIDDKTTLTFTLDTVAGENVVNAGGELGTWIITPNQCHIFQIKPAFHAIFSDFTLMDDAPYSHMKWTSPGNIRTLISEESHGFGSNTQGGAITIERVAVNYLGDESIDLGSPEAKIMVQDVVCNAGHHCIMVKNGSGITIRNNYLTSNFYLYSDLNAGDATKAASDSGVAIAIENHRFVAENIRIVGNVVEGSFAYGIHMSTQTPEDGAVIRSALVKDNRIVLTTDNAYCDESNEDCFSIALSQQLNAEISDIVVENNFLQGRISITSTGTDTGYIGSLTFRNNRIVNRPGSSENAVELEADAVLFDGNDISGFSASCFIIKPVSVNDTAMDSTTFTDSNITVDADAEVPGSSYATVVGHPYYAGDGPVKLSTGGTLPTGLNNSTSYYLRVIGDKIGFALNRAAAFNLEGDDTFTSSNVNTSTEVITMTSHTYTTGDGPFQLIEGGTSGDLPDGLLENVDYYLEVAGNDIQFHLTYDAARGGATPIDLVDVGAAETHVIGVADVVQITTVGSGTTTMDLGHEVVSVRIVNNTLECIGNGGVSRNTIAGTINLNQIPSANDRAYLEIDNNDFYYDFIEVDHDAHSQRFINMVISVKNYRIRNNRFVTHPGRDLTDAIASGLSNKLEVSNNYFDITANIAAISLGSSGSKVFDLVVRDNIIDARNIQYAIRMRNTGRSTVTGNIIRSAGDYAILIDHTLIFPDGVGHVISNNQISASRGMNIACTDSCVLLTGLVINGNLMNWTDWPVSGTVGIAMQLDDVVSSAVTGNVCINDKALNAVATSHRCLNASGSSNYLSVVGNASSGGGTGFRTNTAAGGAGCTNSGSGANTQCDLNTSN